jgi:hypothetical protein
MKKLSSATLLFCTVFLLGCFGCCSGCTEGFMKGFNEGFNSSFDSSFRTSFVESCAKGVSDPPTPEAQRICGCMADNMLAKYDPTELLKLSTQTNSPEFGKIIEEAMKGCTVP